MKNSTMLMIIGVIVILGIFIYISSGSEAKTVTGNSVNVAGNGDVQKITLSIKDYNYYPNTITVKAGQPVQISLDDSIKGCYRSFNIKQLGISKYVKTPKDTIDFTPTQKGTFRFACSMGMGTGTLIVE